MYDILNKIKLEMNIKDDTAGKMNENKLRQFGHHDEKI